MANKGTNLQVPISPNGLRGFLIKLVGFVDLLLEKSSADPVALTGSELAELNIRGLDVQAMRHADGSIVGSSSYGSFVLWPNGRAECEYQSAAEVTTTITDTGVSYYNIVFLNFPIEFIEYPVCNAIGASSYGDGWSDVSKNRYTDKIRLLVMSNAAYTRILPGYRAIGRWK